MSRSTPPPTNGQGTSEDVPVPSALPRFEPWPRATTENPWRKDTRPSFRPPAAGEQLEGRAHLPEARPAGDDSPPTTRVSEAPPTLAGQVPAPRLTSGLEPRADRRADELEAQIDALPGRLLAGRYELGDPIAVGGTGAVYAAIDVEAAEPRAVKILYQRHAHDASTAARFLDEARAQQQIESPHVVRVFEADTSDALGVPFIAMERLVGDDLGSELDRRGRLPPPEVIGYLRQLASVLDEAHAIGIVHRDLKPANLFATLRPPPRPEGGTRLLKVLDFGSAKVAGAASQHDALSGPRPRAGTLVGTPWYMSPEQASGRADDAGPASDRWALGTLAYRLLTGGHYWASEALEDLIPEILAGPVHRPSERAGMLGAHFDAWFSKACALEPSARFPTAAMQVLMLTKALAEDGVRFWAPGSHPPRPGR